MEHHRQCEGRGGGGGSVVSIVSGDAVGAGSSASAAAATAVALPPARYAELKRRSAPAAPLVATADDLRAALQQHPRRFGYGSVALARLMAV